MKPLLKPLSIIAAILFCNILFAQKIFTGYYINVQGDTVKGVFPKYTQWGKSPQQVEFIRPDTGAILLSPANCGSFTVEGYDTYISYSGARLLNPIEDHLVMDNNAVTNQADSSERVSVFLRLITGTTGAVLFEFNDNKRTNYFYQLPGQPVIELVYKKYYIQNQIGEISEYKKQLYASFSSKINEKNLTAALNDLPYREKELSDFLNKIFTAALATNKKSSVKAKWIVSAGISINMLAIAPKGDPALVPSFSSTVAPLLSIGCIVPIDRNFERYFFYPQLRFFSYKNTGEINGISLSTITEVTYKAPLIAILDLNGGVNIINKEKLRFFITTGVGLLTQINGKRMEQLYAASDHTPYMSAHETDLPLLSFPVNAGAGVAIHRKIFVTARYMLPATVTDFVDFEARLSGVQFTLGYGF